MPSGIPAANFWSIVVYDVWTRSMLANGQGEASKNSYDPALAVGDDGSEDLCFGPEPPAAGASNWIRTLPGKGWVHDPAPLRAARGLHGQSWKPSDVEPA